MNSSQGRLLRLIAVFKLIKAALLIFVGIGILKLVHKDVAAVAEHWVLRFGLDPGSRHINQLIQRFTRVPPHRIRELGIGTFLYAAVFLTEGVGLWLLKRWAEWFTVVATGLLVPVEAYEIYLHPTLIKVGVLFINVAIVGYLIYRIQRERHNSRRQYSFQAP